MLKPQILLGDRIENTSTKVFRRIQNSFLSEYSNANSADINKKVDAYTLSTLLSPFFYSLDSLPLPNHSPLTKSNLIAKITGNLKNTMRPEGSFEFKNSSIKVNKLFSSSLCLLNLINIFQDDLNNCYHELQSGLNFLNKNIFGLRPKVNSFRADECLAAYALLQASIVLKDKKFARYGSGYFDSIFTSNKAIKLGKNSLLPNLIDESLITRILIDLYDLSGKEEFLFQAQNLSRASILQQQKVLDSFQSGSLGKFFVKPVNLTVLSLSCYNCLRLYQITKEGYLLDLSGQIMRFISDVIDRSLEKNILFPSWIKPQIYELSQESCPLGARFYLDTAILSKEYFPVSIKQAQAKKVIPLLRVRA